MVDTFLLFSIALTFFSSVVLCRWWIRRAHDSDLVGKDMHKISRQKVAEVGGLPVLFAFLFGILIFVGAKTFYFGNLAYEREIFAAVLTIAIIAMIGFIDDILGWKIGLRQWQKPLLCLFAALPVMMINSGVSHMNLPFFGLVELGILYALIVVPIIISGAANGFNMLAGYNGLEAGMGIIILGALGFIVWQVQGLSHVAMIAAIMIAALLGFLIFNKHPAKVFPGDTLTYMVGATIAVVAILGNVEKAAFILFIPYFIEFFLKSRGGFRKESFAHVRDDGYLEKPYDKIYGLEHLMIAVLNRIGIKATEKRVVYSIYLIETVFVLLMIYFVI